MEGLDHECESLMVWTCTAGESGNTEMPEERKTTQKVYGGRACDRGSAAIRCDDP